VDIEASRQYWKEHCAILPLVLLPISVSLLPPTSALKMHNRHSTINSQHMFTKQQYQNTRNIMTSTPSHSQSDPVPAPQRHHIPTTMYFTSLTKKAESSIPIEPADDWRYISTAISGLIGQALFHGNGLAINGRTDMRVWIHWYPPISYLELSS